MGTGSSKGVLVDPSGTVVASETVSHSMQLPRPGWAEVDAKGLWWREVCSISTALSAQVPDGSTVAAMCVSGVGPCLVLCDDDLNPLRPAILYGVDTRAFAEIRSLTAEFGADTIRDRAGTPRMHDGRVRMEIGSDAGYLDTVVTDVAEGSTVTIGIRPQDCALRRATPPASARPSPTSSICSSSASRPAAWPGWRKERKESSSRLPPRKATAWSNKSRSPRHPSGCTFSIPTLEIVCDDQAIQ